MRSRRLPAALAAAAVLTAAAAPAAQADLPWGPCDNPAGFECATLSVPLDRTGAVPGTVQLSARRVPAASNPTRTAVVALAGGPGQAALPLSTTFAEVLGPAITTRDLLLFDQRGTGESDPLDCPAAHKRGTALALTRKCAEELGPARGFFTTPDSAADLEDLRREAGYDKLAIYGVSYGTKLALDYAARYPEHVERLVLDSVVPPGGIDPLYRPTLQAVPRVVRDLCAGGACARATDSPTADIRTLARKLARKGMKGRVIDPRGHRLTATVTEAGLARVLLAGDLNPALRADLPGAARAALRGDATPLLRLSARSAGLSNRAQSTTEGDNEILYLTTTCEETAFPWSRDGSIKVRSREATSAARALPAGATGPFSRTVALELGPFGLCLSWPNAAPAPQAPGPLPDVPVLVVEGQGDLRTPLESGQAVASMFPAAQVLEVPFTGHSVVTTDLSTCARDAIGPFFSGAAVAPCAAGAPRFAPTPRPPTRLSKVKALSGTHGKAGRTLAAVRVTAADASSGALGAAIALNQLGFRIGGLRGGYERVSTAGTVSLVKYVYVPGVVVSGALPSQGTAHLRVSGPAAAHGSVTITTSGSSSGKLGGHHVQSARTASPTARRAKLPSLHDVRALPGFGH